MHVYLTTMPEHSREDWIGVDLDGTLAYYDHFRGNTHIGPPIPLMVTRVKRWLKEGKRVKIFTARLSWPNPEETLTAIEEWCRTHIGQRLPCTNIKDSYMVELWDDRAFRVTQNNGRLATWWTTDAT